MQIKDSKKKCGRGGEGRSEERREKEMSPNCGETLGKPLLFDPSFTSEKRREWTRVP